MATVTLILFCLASLIDLSHSSEHETCQAFSSWSVVSILDPVVLFAHGPVADLEGVDDRGRASLLQDSLSGDVDKTSTVGDLLRGLSKIQDPHVSEPIARLVSGILEEKYCEMLSDSSTEELERLLKDPGDEPVRFMSDMKLLSNAPVMRHYLLRSFYRVVGRVQNANWLKVAMARHLQTVVAGSASEREDLRCILHCAILEAVQSASLLPALCGGLISSKFGTLDDYMNDLANLLSGELNFSFYCGVIDLYFMLGPPLASEVVALQSGIDWKQAFQFYKVLPKSFSFHEIHDYLMLSLPIDSEDPYLRQIFSNQSTPLILVRTRGLVFDHIRHGQREPLIDIRPGIKRYINFLWHRGEKLGAQALAIAVCCLYDTSEWVGEASWKVQGLLAPGSGLTRTDQVTVFHGLPREILPKIGPVMPILVSKATYQLTDLRASFSTLTYFMNKALRPFDPDVIEKVLHLHHGWAAGMSKDDIARARDKIFTLSMVGWVDRVCEVARFQEDRSVTLARQGRLGKFKLDHSIVPPVQVGFLILSLVFGTAPFELSDANERLDFLAIVKLLYPRFVSIVQALESLTRNVGDKFSRVHALVSVPIDYCLSWTLFQEWLFTRYLSETELIELMVTCDMDSPFWCTVMDLCRSDSRFLVPLGALKRCAGVAKQGLLTHKITRVKARAMAVALGMSEALADGVLNGDSRFLSAVFPSAVAGASPYWGHPSLRSWINSVPNDRLSEAWFIVSNFSDNDMISMLKHGGRELKKNSMRILSCCLSAPAKDRIIIEYARDPSTFDGDIIKAIMETQEHVCDGWEPESTVFDEKEFQSEEYRLSVGACGEGALARLSSYCRKLLTCDRFEYFLFANLQPEVIGFAKEVHIRVPNIDVVLLMLLEGHTAESIGGSLYLLAGGDTGAVEKIMSASSVRQKYLDEINMSVGEFARGPGKVLGQNGLVQQRRFIETFDMATVEGNLLACTKVYRSVLESLETPVNDGHQKALGLEIVYSDGEVLESVAVSLDLPPAYLFRQILKVVREPFELMIDHDDLYAAATIRDLELPDTIAVRMLNDHRRIAMQLKVVFQLIMKGVK